MKTRLQFERPMSSALNIAAATNSEVVCVCVCVCVGLG